jgi:competence protein ComEA
MLKKLLIVLLASFALCSFAIAAADLNTASQQQLEAIKGIGPQKAKAIIEYRAKNGAFKTTEDVMKVPGIKEGIYNKIKGEITVGGKGAVAPTPAAAKASAPKKK